MDPNKELLQTLKHEGAHLLRNKKHQIYRLPTGQNFVFASTASDHRSSRNALKSLQNILGLKAPKAPQTGEPTRSPKKVAHSAAQPRKLEVAETLSSGGRSLQSELQAQLANLVSRPKGTSRIRHPQRNNA